jgi:hypothetical protein
MPRPPARAAASPLDLNDVAAGPSFAPANVRDSYTFGTSLGQSRAAWLDRVRDDELEAAARQMLTPATVHRLGALDGDARMAAYGELCGEIARAARAALAWTSRAGPSTHRPAV